DSRAERSQRHPANRSHRGGCASLERAVARTGAVDRHLLLLPNRNGDAQYAAASDPARGSRLEETVVRATWTQHRPGRNRKTAKTRAAAGRTFGGYFEAGKTDTRSGAPATKFAR